MPASAIRHALSASGDTLLDAAAGAWRAVRLAADAVVAALSPSTYTPAVRAIAARQVCESAWEVLPGVAAASAVLGYLVIGIVDATARGFGLSGYALELFVRLVVMELVPLFVALFVALRSGAAIGTTVALLRLEGRLDPERGLADPLRQALLPRGMGVAAAVLALTAAGCLAALVTAYLGLYGLSPWGHAAFARTVGQAFGPAVAFGLALKVLFFALAVAVIPVAASLAAPRDERLVAAAAPRGLVRVFASLALMEVVALAFTYG